MSKVNGDLADTVACHWRPPSCCSPPLAASTSSEPSYATVTIGPLTYRVEVATDRTSSNDKGSRAGSTLPAGTGMLFQFGSRREQQVWMAGMTIPLDIAWIADNKVVAIDTLAACDLRPTRTSAHDGPHPALSMHFSRSPRIAGHHRARGCPSPSRSCPDHPCNLRTHRTSAS